MTSHEPATLLKLDGIKKVFFTEELETHALSDIHVEIKKGEYVAIEGPSGSGKTTLLSILGLLDAPSAGEYLLQGRPVAQLSARERARIRNREVGFIFQTFNLIGNLSVWENVELPLLYRNISAQERKERVANALERVKMSHRKNHMPSQLSGGQQQRVSVARAVAGDPAIVFADEPTGSLDSTQRRRGHGSPRRAPRRRRDDLHGDAQPRVREARHARDPPLRRAMVEDVAHVAA